jgi:hypothetical protein
MSTRFARMNIDWNAEPNAPYPVVEEVGEDVTLTFLLNAFRFSRFREGGVGIIRFKNCWRYRLGSTNDEGWYRGQCRFSKLAPSWGEFYEVDGDLLIDTAPDEWTVRRSPTVDSRHFLFYLRDETFECDAQDWALQVTPTGSNG